MTAAAPTGPGIGPGIGPLSYGKAGIRFLQVERLGEAERVSEVVARVRLRGGIDEAYLEGDNGRMVTTDALAGLVQERCGELAGEAPETMAGAVVAELSERYPHLPDVAVSLDVRALDPVGTGSGARAHVRSSPEVAAASVRRCGATIRCRSRLRGLTLVRTSGSRFDGFLVDRFTTTWPATDRAVGGAVEATWRVAGDGDGVDWVALRAGVREALVTAFATEESASVQQLVFLMARRALEAEAGPEAIEVRLSSIRLSPPPPPPPPLLLLLLLPPPPPVVAVAAGPGREVPRTLGVAEAPRGQVRVRLARRMLGTLVPAGGGEGGAR